MRGTHLQGKGTGLPCEERLCQLSSQALTSQVWLQVQLPGPVWAQGWCCQSRGLPRAKQKSPQAPMALQVWGFWEQSPPASGAGEGSGLRWLAPEAAPKAQVVRGWVVVRRGLPELAGARAQGR